MWEVPILRRLGWGGSDFRSADARRWVAVDRQACLLEAHEGWASLAWLVDLGKPNVGGSLLHFVIG